MSSIFVNVNVWKSLIIIFSILADVIKLYMKSEEHSKEKKKNVFIK